MLEKIRRVFDSKPWAAHLYVTDQCNLDCHYCNEYDNSIPHPSLADLKKWIVKIRDLGVVRLGLQGGEPLMHPDIVEIVRFAKEAGLSPISLSTNGLLLTEEMAGQLKSAGLDVLQLSIDRMTPIASTRKSLKSVAHKFEYLRKVELPVQVSGVLFEDTIEEMEEVMDHCLSRGIKAHARVAHDDLIRGEKSALGPSKQRYLDFLDMEESRKLNGETIHTSWNALHYQRTLLRGEETSWTCVAGYKYFFVSARGKFWLCSQVRTEKDILDVTNEDLLGYNRKKDCQKGCGVYCIVGMSHLVSHPIRYIAREGWGLARKAAKEVLR